MTFPSGLFHDPLYECADNDEGTNASELLRVVEKWRTPTNFTQVILHSFVFSASLTVFVLTLPFASSDASQTAAEKKKKRKVYFKFRNFV